LVSIRCSCLHCDKLLLVFLSELYSLKLHQTDIRQTYQLGQFTGCLLSHRPFITKEFFKLHPPHCAHFLRHEVMLCRVVQPSWLARLASPAAAGPEIYLGYRAGKLRQKRTKGRAGCHMFVPTDKCSSFQCNRCLMLFDIILVLFLLLLGQLLGRF